MMRSTILGTGKGKAQRSVLDEDACADHSSGISGFLSIRCSSVAPFFLKLLANRFTVVQLQDFSLTGKTRKQVIFFTLQPTFVLQTVVLLLWRASR